MKWILHFFRIYAYTGGMKMGLPQKKQDRHYRYEDYRSWPDDERWELIDGVAWNMSPAPGMEHQHISSRIYRILSAFFEGKSCTAFYAPLDVVLPEGTDRR